LYPDEVFSTNEQFGAMTSANGYAEANVIIGSKFEKDMGGGVCQVSSTLYVSILQAELEIVERVNHSLKVSYADYGFDATLADKYIDLKFKNDTQYPILIEGIMDGREVTVNIYGYEIHAPGRVVKLENNLLSTTPAPEGTVVEDDTLPLGEEVIEVPKRDGYRYELIKTVFENNVQISSSVVNRSTYKATAEEKHIGTNPYLPRTTDPEEAPGADDTRQANPPDLEGLNPGGVAESGDEPADEPPQNIGEPDIGDWPEGIPLPSDLY
jgi:hypothetical protein